MEFLTEREKEKGKVLLKYFFYSLLWIIGIMTIYLSGLFVGYSVATLTMKYPELYESGLTILTYIEPSPGKIEAAMYIGILLGVFISEFSYAKFTKLKPYLDMYKEDFNKRVDAEAENDEVQKP